MGLFARPASMPGRTGAVSFNPAPCRRTNYDAKPYFKAGCALWERILSATNQPYPHADLLVPTLCFLVPTLCFLVPTLCFLVPTLRVGMQLQPWLKGPADCLNWRPAGAQTITRSHISKQTVHCRSGSYPRQASPTLTLIGRVGTAHQSRCRLLPLVTSFINY